MSAEQTNSFKTGLSLGLSGKALPWKKEPVAWLYGHVAKEGETPTHTIDGVGYVGVVLPKLPEWDKEKYPYAVIKKIGVTVDRGGMYLLHLVDRPFVQKIVTVEIDPGSAYITYQTYTDPAYVDTAAWGAWELYESGSAFGDSGFGKELSKSNTQWANTDIVDQLGDIKCVASEPVPVYE